MSSGEQLPLGARILATADVFHALSEERSYRPASETEEILDIMDSEAGDHLDPEVYQALKDML